MIGAFVSKTALCTFLPCNSLDFLLLNRINTTSECFLLAFLAIGRLLETRGLHSGAFEIRAALEIIFLKDASCVCLCEHLTTPFITLHVKDVSYAHAISTWTVMMLWQHWHWLSQRNFIVDRCQHMSITLRHKHPCPWLWHIISPFFHSNYSQKYHGKWGAFRCRYWVGR